MICNNTKELLAEINKYMDLNNIQKKNLAASMNKKQQNISQIFKHGNPSCNTLFEVLDALNVKLDVNFIKSNQGDTH